MTSLSEVDPSTGTFRAELYYWVSGKGIEGDNGKIPASFLKDIRFPGKVDSSMSTLVSDTNGRRVEKFSGRFSADFHLGISIILVSVISRHSKARSQFSLATFLAIIAFGITFYTVKPIANVLTMVDKLYLATLALSVLQLLGDEVRLNRKVVEGEDNRLLGPTIWLIAVLAYCVLLAQILFAN